MPVPPSDLKGLRRRLDEIDDKLQDLLIDRAQIVSLVGASKKDDNRPAYQPAREAEIIRRLVGRHRGAFPVATLVRMWREGLSPPAPVGTSFLVAVFTPAPRSRFCVLVLTHYSLTTARLVYSA